jgi:sentrin-specific protease 1
VLRPEITPAEEEAYTLAMQGDDGVVLLERFNARLYRSQILCMRPGTWLNDEIINHYFYLLQERSEHLCKDFAPGQRGQGTNLRCYMHSTLFLSKLTFGGVYTYSRVEKWTTRGTRLADLFEKDIVFFPHNIGGIHWALCAAYMVGHRLEYFDSMSTDEKGLTGKECMENVLRYLSDEHTRLGKGPLDTSEWSCMNHGKSCPQQTNSNDCGVFMCSFVKHLSVGAPLDFSQNNMDYYRKRITSYVLTGNPVSRE